MIENKYKHYLRLNENNEIIHAFSSVFEQPLEGDILYRESTEGHFNMNLRSIEGDWLYKYIDGEIVDNPVSDAVLLQREIVKRLTALDIKYYGLFSQGFVFEGVTYDCQMSDITYFQAMKLSATLDEYTYEPDGLKDVCKDKTGAYVTMPSKAKILELVSFGTKHVVDLRKAYSDEELEIKALTVSDL